ncbi:MULTISPECIES: hypothetical protein [unclassified Pseudobutyrivibrio]|uniref:hypothetical protein n=1 Tax=unclassified Pseudobutyrivibrio TaxID=2638619 RepID=UPI0005D2838A|nr:MULTISPECIES: hypothetical protein [unclassified Pseudobutyrivibrio]SES92839.1 hypothetical protein SAMN02910413_1296 [Pseudobutyrivibrio sp. C4]
MQQLRCKKCGCEFSGPLASNAMYLCPKCKEYVNCLCEYGFGPIVPCSIFLGEEEIARIEERERIKYQLKSATLGLDAALSKGYKNLEVYYEALDIVTEALREG